MIKKTIIENSLSAII